MKTKNKYLIAFFTILIGITVLVVRGRIKTSSEGKKNYPRTETFTFASDGGAIEGKIYLPASYKKNPNLQAIYLIDFTEQHFKIARDEFERVIDGVQQIEGTEALVLSLNTIPDKDSKPESFREYYNLFKNMVAYVDSHYTRNTLRTFMGRGSEGSISLMALFSESYETSIFDNFIVTDSSPNFTTAIINLIENSTAEKYQAEKKLHFSFSTSNDRTKCLKVIDRIKKANLPWLKFQFIEYKTSNYENTYHIAFADGLEYVFTP
jgi:hypothetical protein